MLLLSTVWQWSAHTFTHSFTHKHICFSILANWTLPAKPASSCFSSSQQRHGRGVVASQVCRRLWVPSCMFLPSIYLLLCLPAFPLPPSCPLLSSLFASFVSLAFDLSFCSHPPLPFSLLSLSVSLPLSLSLSPSSVLIEVQYCMLVDCCPSHSPISDGLLQHTTQHVGCWAWEAQAFALCNRVRLLLQSLNHAESEHLLPAHSLRVGPSA